MKKIAVITATRAEYGLLSPVLTELRRFENEGFCAELIVTGTHLSEAYGRTIEEIEKSGQRIDRVVWIPLASRNAIDISKDQAHTLISFTEIFETEKYNAILLLGDRYEMLAIAIAAANTHTPVFHMCGGDTTEGAADEWIRHSITKISYLHFVTNRDSRRRVIQLGEAPERVYDLGSTVIDNLKRIRKMTRQEALDSIGLEDVKYALCTWQPVSLDPEETVRGLKHLFQAMQIFPEIVFIVTKANADLDGERINNALEEAVKGVPNMRLYASLGVERYLNLMRHCAFVIGNSSSGIIEAPACGVPTVNIGIRQKGRLSADSVIHCGAERQEIIDAVRTALSEEHIYKCRSIENPYGSGEAAPAIARICYETISEKEIDLKKSFYDMRERTNDPAKS